MNCRTLAALSLLAGLLPAQLPFSSPLRRVTFTASSGNLDSPVIATRVSDDGQRVLFVTAAQNVGVGAPAPLRSDIYLRDTATGQITVVGIGLGINTNTTDAVHMSADGRFVLFLGSGANGSLAGTHVWLRDTTSGALELVDANAVGAPANSTQLGAHGISADGRHVLFSSDATDLPGASGLGYTLYRLDRQTGALQNVIVDSTGTPRTATFGVAGMTADARFVTFASAHADLVPGDTNNRFDHFVRDLQTGLIERLSVGTGGFEATGNSQRPAVLSADGRFAVFATSASNLEPSLTQTPGGAFYVVRDRLLDTTRALAISPFGFPATVATAAQFETPQFLDRTHVAVYATRVPLLATTLPTSVIAQVFATDVDTGATTMVSNRLGSPADATSHLPAVSRNGRQIVFASSATNLDPTAPAPTPFAVEEVFHTELDCHASSSPFGAGHPGTGGIVPLLFGTNADCGSSVTVFAGGALGGAPMFLLFGMPAAPALPIAGIDVHVDLAQPFTLLGVANGGLPGIPGAGSWFTQLPVAALNNTLAMQVVCLDPGASSGLSATNGISIQVN